MANAIVQINGIRTSVPTVLGAGPARIPTGGKIRAGIKVLTKRAAENPRAKEIYERGVAASQSFEQIERLIVDAVPDLKTPLVPKNVPWFTVRGEDFPNPRIAKDILDAYGEDRGDGMLRLYRFPVVFPSDTWQTIMPHELVAWGANEKRFWSEYSPDGRIRYCKCHAPVPKDDSGKRAIRIFGGRKSTLRDANGGICNPESCPEYQQRQCNLSGTFVFFIPGIKSINAFELHTNSFYAMNAAIQRFETIAFMRGGRISGFLDGKQTPFYFAKQLLEVPHIDEEGRAVRVKQWIINLEAPIDVTALLRAHEDDDAALANARAAVRIVEGAPGADEAIEISQPPSAKHDVGLLAQSGVSAADGSRGQRTAAKSNSAANALKPATTTAAALPRTAVPAGPSLEDVLAAAEQLGLQAARYDQYASKRWGAGWKVNATGRRRALEEIESFRECPAALVTKIDAELDLFA